MPIPASGTGMTGHAVNRAFRRMVTRAPDFDAKNATSHGLRAGVPADLAAQGYSPAEIMVITEDWKSSTMVEKYAKASLPRAGKDSMSRAQQALDTLVVPPPEDCSRVAGRAGLSGSGHRVGGAGKQHVEQSNAALSILDAEREVGAAPSTGHQTLAPKQEHGGGTAVLTWYPQLPT